MEKEKPKDGLTQIQWSLFIITIVVSAICTYGFFSEFLSSMIPPTIIGDPTAAAMVAGVIGVVMLDGAALVWQLIGERKAESVTQIIIAKRMSKVTIGTAVLITFVYLLMTGYNLTRFSSINQITATVGLFVVTAVFCYSFYSVWQYFHESPEAREREQETKLKAQRNDEIHNIQNDFGDDVILALRREMENQRSLIVEEAKGTLVENTRRQIMGAIGDVTNITRVPEIVTVQSTGGNKALPEIKEVAPPPQEEEETTDRPF